MFRVSGHVSESSNHAQCESRAFRPDRVMVISGEAAPDEALARHGELREVSETCACEVVPANDLDVCRYARRQRPGLCLQASGAGTCEN